MSFIYIFNEWVYFRLKLKKWLKLKLDKELKWYFQKVDFLTLYEKTDLY